MSAHPHAEAMALYAQDAAETETPWERWQIKYSPEDLDWFNLGEHPKWIEKCQYRRKPQPRRWETWVSREADYITGSCSDMDGYHGWEKITVEEVMQ